MSAPLPPLAASRSAVVTVDLHRGHLDPDVATMPLPPEVAASVTQANARFLARARSADLLVVHVLTSYRNVQEISSNPWWRAVAGTSAGRGNVLSHQLPGSPGLDFMPGLYDPVSDLVVATKKRYDCFLHTDLEHALRSLGVEAVLVTGVNTNSCVLATAIAASVRDFATLVLSDCVATLDPQLHQSALDVIDGAFGWVVESTRALELVRTDQGPVHA